MPIDEVRPRHIRDLVLTMRKDGALAPRSIRNVYGVLATMFRTAVADELILATPCALSRGILPKKVDKAPAWRATAIFTRPEVEQLISDARIPEDRRVLYALKGIAGLRHTEAATLRWRQYDATLEPLGALNLEKTKTGVPRRIPVHPTLARLLAEWKLSGWERTYGRRPEADDIIVPTRNFTERPSSDSQRSLGLDLDTLKLRRRRGHDLRRTFVTLAQVDGARRDLLETITHGPRGDIINVYSSFPWPALCAEVAKLEVDVRGGQVIEAEFATEFATRQESARRRWGKGATPAGFESVRDLTRPHVECKNPGEATGFEEATSGHAGPNCNDCNEARARLARVAKNALLNGDFPRVVSILDQLSGLTNDRRICP
jgi:integrase